MFLFSEYLFESATKVWTRFVEGELRITDKIQQQIMHVGSVCIRIERSLLNLEFGRSPDLLEVSSFSFILNGIQGLLADAYFASDM